MQVLQDCTGDEFIIFMKLLSHLKVMQTLQGRKQLIEIVADQVELERELDVSEPDNVDRLIQCFRQALPHFSVSFSAIYVHDCSLLDAACKT